MKYFRLILSIIFILLLSGCSSNQGKIVDIRATSESPQSDKDTNKPIKELIATFYQAIDNQDSNLLGEIVDKEGFLLLRTFTSGYGLKGAEISEIVNPNIIPKNLEFDIIKDENPVSLKTEFQSDNKDYDKMKIISTDVSIDWDNLTKPDILNYLSKLTSYEKDLGNKTIIFMLKDGSFCLAQFAGSDLQYSRWAAFQKDANCYSLKIIAIVN